MRDHWPHHARQWALVGPPLRPGAGDVARLCGEVGPDARVLLLGVTPELAGVPCRSLVAVDRSAAMIEAIFPPGPAAAAVRGDWCALPLADRSIDVAIGDGSLSNLRFPDQYVGFAGELRRVLAPGGKAALRVFTSPAPAAPPASFHALKWQIAMAIAPPDRNVAVAAIHAAFDAQHPDRAALAARTGWPRAEIDTIDAYRGADLRYSFPTLLEVCGALALGDARVLAGDPYPTLVWTPGG
jgi:SAM-dependent methyltransferase